MSKYKLSEEDKALFREAIGKTAPITSTQRDASPLPAKSTSVPRPTVNPSHRALPTEPLFLSNAYSTSLTGETPLFYCRSAIEKNQLAQFKRGQIKIEGRLDLHGCTTEEAKTALLQFLTQHIQSRHRTLLIIHGKGKHGGAPQIKNLVNHWLPQVPAVLAFVSAQPKDGGTGAVYVLLRNQAS